MGPLRKQCELHRHKKVPGDTDTIILWYLPLPWVWSTRESSRHLGTTHLPSGHVSSKPTDMCMYNQPVQSPYSMRQCFVVKQNWDEITIILSNILWEFGIGGTFCDVLLSDLKHFDSFFFSSSHKRQNALRLVYYTTSLRCIWILGWCREFVVIPDN